MTAAPRLFYSNQAEALLDRLAQNLDEDARRPGRSRLEPHTLLVPNRNVESWVRLGLARRRGVAANLDVRRLVRFASELAQAARPIPKRQRSRATDTQPAHVGEARLADADAVTGLLLVALSDAALLAHPDLGEVVTYLEAAGTSRGAMDRRRVELAQALARLFEEYGYSRPRLLAGWRAGRVALADTPFAVTETWQRRLFLAIWGKGGLAEERARAGGFTWRSVGELLVPSPSSGRAGLGGVTLPAAIDVFGYSYVAPGFLALFERLARETDLRIYAPNPCREFWHDAPTRRIGALSDGESDAAPPLELLDRGDPGAPGSDLFASDAAVGSAALAAWGRPGREFVRALDELCHYDHTADFRDHVPTDPGVLPTLLERVQQAILDGRDPDPRAPLPPRREGDASVRVLACPGVRRECEAIADAIWRLVTEDAATKREPPLRFNDVAIVIAGREPERHLPHLRAALTECHGVPHNVVDVRGAEASRVVEALLLLLELPTLLQPAVTREQVLRVVTHPVVMARFPDATRTEWARLADELGVAHGVDADDHAGSYIARDILHWDQALRRAALAAYLPEGDGSDGESGFVTARGESFAPSLTPQRLERAAELGLLVRGLLADARALARGQLPMAQWIERLGVVAETYLCPRDDDERRDLLRCQRALADLAAVDTFDARLGYGVVHRLAVAALAGQTASVGQYLGGGVVVSQLVPMRAIPFRVVFVCGLDEGQFPAAERHDPLDLRRAAREPGDVTPRDGDRYLFLETLLAAKDALCLSYVARDPLTGEALAPSPLVTDLLELCAGFVGREDSRALTERPPLRRHEAAGTRFVEARREHEARSLGRSLAATVGHALALGDVDRLATQLAAPAFAALEAALAIAPAPALAGTLTAVTTTAAATENVAPERRLRVPLATLRAFLDCPLQGYARFRLKLTEDEGDPAAIADEPFQTELPDTVGLLRRVVGEALMLGVDPLARYDAEVTRLELGGLAPTGVFAEVERAKHRRWITAWLTQLAALPGTGGRARVARVIRFGGADERAPFAARAEAVDPLWLDVEVAGSLVPVEITGRTNPLVSLDGRALASLVLSNREGKNGRGADGRPRDERDALRGFLDHALLAATGTIGEGSPHACVVLRSDGGREPLQVAFAPFGASEARAWLGALVADLVGGAHEYALPIEAVLIAHDRNGSITEELQKLREGSRGRPLSSEYGPLRDPTRYPPLDEEQAQRVAARRLGPYLRHRHIANDGPPPEGDGADGDRDAATERGS